MTERTELIENRKKHFERLPADEKPLCRFNTKPGAPGRACGCAAVGVSDDGLFYCRKHLGAQGTP